MIDLVKALLQERQVTRAVIIDDAFDDRPRSGDVDDALWDRFFDDLVAEDETVIVQAYGADAYEQRDPTELRRDQRFINVVWDARSTVKTARVLFEEFERTQDHKRADLEPLRRLLEQDLSLTCGTVGRDQSPDIADANIIFLDLFLGLLEGEEAIQRAIERVKGVVAERRTAPPSVVLMSASPRLAELGPRLRDEAELLGCQFRMVRKSDFGDTETMAERLYELVLSYPDALRLNAFLLAWDTALNKAKTEFVRSIRTLDLADYANMQALILEAEGEPVGDYVLDLYDLHLHNVLEGDADLVRAAKALNAIGWEEYPPAQFVPSAEAVGIMDGALFHNQLRTTVEMEIDANPAAARLGDIFLGPAGEPGAGVEGQQDAPVAPPARHAYVVLSQACDLQHGEADRLLLLRGTIQPYSWKQHDSKVQGPRTPIMRVDDEYFAVEWDILAPETWLLDDLPRRLDQGYRRVRRLRTPFALQLQQSFIGRLGRVGTLTALPARHAVGVRVFLRNRAGNAELLAEAAVDRGDAVCLVGRTERNALKEWLLLSERLQDEIRRNLRGVDLDNLPVGAPQIAVVRDDPEFYRRLKRGLLLNRGSSKGTKPFKDTPQDVVQILTRPALEPGAPVDRSFHPIIIEIDIE